MFPWLDGVRTRPLPGAPWLVEHHCRFHGCIGLSGTNPEAQRKKRLQHERLVEHDLDSDLMSALDEPDPFAGPEFTDPIGDTFTEMGGQS